MNGSMLLAVAVAAVGIDYGWKPHPDGGGGLEYTIQVKADAIDRLKAGFDISSDIPAELKNIRSFRIKVGSGELPRIDEEPTMTGNRNYFPALDPLEPRPKPADRLDQIPWSETSEGQVKQAVMYQGVDPKPVLAEAPRLTPEPDTIEPDTPPWLVAALTVGLMGVSSGLLFTGWTAWDYRERYRTVLERLTAEERTKLDGWTGVAAQKPLVDGRAIQSIRQDNRRR